LVISFATKKANSSLTAGNYNEPVEVKSVSGNTITLYNNWPGSTGTTSATIKPSAAAAASAGVAAQQLITDIQSLVGSASATATANSFVKRDSNGRIKASSPSTNDDVVNKGYFQSDAALNNAGIFHDGNSVNPLDYGMGTHYSGNGTPSDLKNVSLDALKGGLYTGYEGNNHSASLGGNPYPNGGAAFGMLNITGVDNDPAKYLVQIAAKYSSSADIKFRTKAIADFSEWRTFYHSGNTNFNEFGGISSNCLIAYGYAASSTIAVLYLPISSKGKPSSISITSTFRLVSFTGTVATGLSSSIQIQAVKSTNKWLVCDISGLSGLTTEAPLELRSESASSKITVNF